MWNEQDEQNIGRSGILINVEELDDGENLDAIEKADVQPECLQIPGDVTQPEQDEISTTISQSQSQNFSWENFYYPFFFGLLPTAWDIATDLQFGLSQEGEGEDMTAGFCYMFICLPPISLLVPAVFSRVQKEWFKVAESQSTLMSVLYLLLILLVGVAVSSAMAFAFANQPTIFKYPALICSLFTLGVKIFAVFLHTPEMTKFSLNASIAESSYESSAQLLFLLHIWLSGGRMYLTAMVSSTVVIGKVGAENILTNGQENKLKDKSFLEKVFLLARYMPVIALTAIFRLGCASTILYHPDHFVPITPAFAVFLTWIYCMCNVTLLLIILSILKIWISVLRQLNTLEMVLGLMSECTTVTVWGRLGKEGSKGLQLAMATYHLLMNCSYLSWQMATATRIKEAIGVDPYTEPFFIIYQVALTCGPISYLLAIYQLFIMDI